MSFPVSQPPGSDHLPKVPIPRLERVLVDEAPLSPSRSGNKHRVSRACLSCRARKVKCNGGQPQCHNCLGSDKPCVYAQSRKDRLKTATERNQDMINFLKGLKGRVTEDDKQQIDELLGEVVDDVSDAASSLKRRRSSDLGDIHGEANVSAEVGSNRDLDILDGDLLRDEETRATGFVGKGSELQWLRRLQHEMECPEGTSSKFDGRYGPPGDSPKAASRRMEALKRQQQDASSPIQISTSTFYLDNHSIDVDYAVDLFELPPIETAQRLLDSYMNTVQDSFPILSRKTFTSQFYQYYTSIGQGRPLSVPEKWLTVLNLIFAIGAKYSHLIEADWQADDRDHLIYQSRAHMLGLNGPSLLAHPDLLQIQITALLAFYFLSIGHVNRAWVVIGISLRFAYALGLHVRNEDRTATLVKKETLLRMWWGLYSLEGILSTIAGRPSFVLEDYCSAPLPLPLATEQLSDETLMYQFDERYRVASIHQSPSEASSTTSRMSFSTPSRPGSEPSNAGSFLKSMVQVSMITQKAMVDLYSARIVTRSWKHVQQAITSLYEQLEAWLASLPLGLNFTQPNADTSFQRERLILEMYYTRTKILITRPCLCRLDSRIANQTKASDDFNKQTARICVGAAKAMADLLPDHIDTVYLYQTGPWWSLVHNLMQALTVLLLEMSYGTVHFPQNGEEILPSIKKLIRWLRTMKENNKMAERAYTMAFEILQRLAPRVNADISDLLREDAAGPTSPETSNFEDQFTASEYGQGYPFPDGEYSQQFGRQEMHASGFRDIQTGYASMFAFPPGPPHQDSSVLPFMDLGGTFLSNLPQSRPLFGNPFLTPYDERNPVTLDENLFSSDRNKSGRARSRGVLMM
ncbi:hypothetical protein K469DRAFT_723784 [Zopfia rhizophila CBS 207.26]|uniref:Zn(2)-C6 fungal-type domain-containing protein n=1 Tax=Zopfia rhizophila CBS 207.26 TaxID=1314779 RepID=A0A6A6DCB8_9PEZI|nr:hypothetical protein K469DRAFT_723784 [Zopfia rhizophila CBS 207.26]